MTTNKWRPNIGETYYIISDYAPKPYEFVWENSKLDNGRLRDKTLYRTREEAMAAKQASV